MSVDWLSAFSDWLSANPGWLLATLFLTAFVESLAIAGLLVPGVALLFAAATLAGNSGVPLGDCLLWAAIGAIAGDVLSFWIGRLFQGRLDHAWPFSRYPSLLNKGERFFLSHGGKSVVIGRFVGPIRPVIPLVAGALLMPWRRFLLFNVLSAAGWAVVYIFPGFLVGSALESTLQLPPHFYPVLAATLGTLALVYLVLFRVQLGLSSDRPVYLWLASRMAQYNQTHRFWRELTSQRPASGGEFPLPSLILAVGCSALFLLVMLLVAYTDVFAEIDLFTARFFSGLRHPLLDPLFIALSGVADTPMLASAAIIAVCVLMFRGYYAAAVHIAVALVLTWGGVLLVKSGLAIPPTGPGRQPPDSGAFPSGHTAGMTVMAGLIASFVAREQDNHRRWLTYLLFSLPMVAVGMSRLYLGVHWFSDVLGGLLLGLALCGSVRASFSRYDQIPIWLDSTLIAGVIAWTAATMLYLTGSWNGAVSAYRALLS